MTRVLVLLKGLGRGGAEQIAVGTLRHMDPARTACEVAYVLPHKDALVEEVRAMGIAVHRLGPGPGWPLRLGSLVRERGFDIVHSHSPVPASTARVVALRSARHVYTEHNVWQRYRTPTRIANLVTFPRNAHVLAVSESVARSIRMPSGLRGVRMPPLETLYHGVDTARLLDAAAGPDIRAELGIAPEASLVSVVANLKPHKGLDVLLRAAHAVVRDMPEARFLLIGVGSMQQALRSQIRDLRLEANVSMLGFREDVPRILAASTVFALASVHEGLPISLIEAMTLGVPPVVTAVGGIPEVVTDDVDGVLVRAGDDGALAAALLRVLRDPALGARLGGCAQHRARAFDLSVAARRIQDVYAEVAA